MAMCCLVHYLVTERSRSASVFTLTPPMWLYVCVSAKTATLCRTQVRARGIRNPPMTKALYVISALPPELFQEWRYS
eukprot:2104366-Pyramimonas_sp.AAC.1